MNALRYLPALCLCVSLFLPCRGIGAAEAPAPPAPPKAAATDAGVKAQLEKKVSFEFVETPLKDALDFLAKSGNVKITLSAAAEKTQAGPITLKVKDMQLSNALNWILKLADMQYRIENGAVIVDVPKKP